VKEHRPLLAGLALKAHLGFQHKGRVGSTQARSQCMPVGQLQNSAKVGHGHQVVADMAGAGGGEWCAQMQ
jgi:hypothetical protein